mmetsp:Transcript_14230/g.21372  ORF Transcript_14230/g.21372 Transcript_14230/m.21372 type:complete len:327 (-) Transcript_14230:166-1146(-)
MKSFSKSSLTFSVLNLLVATTSAELEDDWTMKTYPAKDFIQNMLPPPTSSPEVGDLPVHLQYIIGLDQSGIVYPTPGIGMDSGDPEFAATLSSGTWTTEKKFFSKPTLTQSISRCQGGGWSLYNNDKPAEMAPGNTGKSFVDLIDSTDESCNLIFHWNKDASNAVITEYFKSNVGYMKPLEYIMKLEIGLTPYWRWKFNLKTSKQEKADALLMDSKCCPPPSASLSCLGEGSLGKADSPCETISMACGEILEENVNQCPFIHRKNGLGKIALNFYNVHALSDKYGNPTSYSKHFVKAYKEKGVVELFHPLERIVPNDTSAMVEEDL